MSGSPLISGPDWRSFTTADSHANRSSGHAWERSAAQGQSQAQVPGQGQTGTPRLDLGLREEATSMLRSDSGSRRSSRLFGQPTDPVGSRPGSRSEVSSLGGSRSPAPGGPMSSSSSLVGTIGSQRPNARELAATASSAAARSRAASPSLSSYNGHGQGEGVAPSLMGLGTSYHAFRLYNSSSPSYTTAMSQPARTPSESNREGSMIISPTARPSVETPKLVIDGFHLPPNGEDFGASSEQEDREQATPATSRGTDSTDTQEHVQSPLSPSGAVTGFHLPTPGQGGLPAKPITAYPGGTSQGLPRRLQPKRTDTGHSSQSSGGGFGQNAPNPHLQSLHITSPNLVSAGQSSNGMLSPNVVAAPAPALSNASFSPFGSPPDSSLDINAGVAQPTSNQQRATSLQYPQMSHQSAVSGRSAATPGRTTSVDEMASSSEFDGSGSAVAFSTFDLQLQASPVIQDIVERLARFELGLKDVNRNISGLSRNVSLLLSHTKVQGGQQPLGGSRTPSTEDLSMRGAADGSADLRALSAQIAALSASVSHLLGGANQNGIIPAQPPTQQLAGLGLGSSTPQLTSMGGGASMSEAGGSMVATPQLSTLGGSRGFTGYHQEARNSRLSPRPGASPVPANRRWSSMVGNEAGGGQPATGGAMVPPDPSVIVTKWDHLNLHGDLLRSILKYGLGPPNKIQQRALPFLLRGTDIIAQAPPTQERIASYVIPVLQLVLNVQRGEPLPAGGSVRGPIAIIISATVDQATQAQRMALGLGSNLGIRVHIAAAGSIDVSQEATAVIQSQAHIIVGTPQKMNDLFTFLANRATGALSLADVRMVVLDEVDQLIARNLSDYVSTLLRILPQPRMMVPSNVERVRSPGLSPGLPPQSSAGGALSAFDSLSSTSAPTTSTTTTTERQTAIFSNTVPQDVLNFAQSIHLRETVRVLVRREGAGAVGAASSVGFGTTGGANGANSPAVGAAGTSAFASGAMGSRNAPGLNTPGQTNGPFGVAPSGFLGGASPIEGQPANALGASPAHSNSNPLADPLLSALRGMRQYYLYVAVSTGGGANSPNPAVAIGSAVSHAVEMKLEVITDLLEDIDFGQAVIYTSSSATHEAVVYKLASKGIEALSLHRDMANITRQQVLAKYRSAAASGGAASYQHAGNQIVGGPGGTPSMKSNRKALVVYDVAVNPREVHQVPLIVFYDLPRSVEEYKEKLACAAAGGLGRPSVCVNVVTGSGGPRGDIEMLRTLECHLGCKMAELPMNPGQILNF